MTRAHPQVDDFDVEQVNAREPVSIITPGGGDRGEAEPEGGSVPRMLVAILALKGFGPFPSSQYVLTFSRYRYQASVSLAQSS